LLKDSSAEETHLEQTRFGAAFVYWDARANKKYKKPLREIGLKSGETHSRIANAAYAGIQRNTSYDC
jgi:hypothetical protein